MSIALPTTRSTHGVWGKFGGGVLPPDFRNFPCRLGDKGGESKPVIVLVFLEIGEGEHKKVIQ